jgi:hypothetical protein
MAHPKKPRISKSAIKNMKGIQDWADRIQKVIEKNKIECVGGYYSFGKIQVKMRELIQSNFVA